MSLLDLAGLSVTSHSRLNSPFLDCVVLVVEGRGRESNTNHAAAAAAAKLLQSCPTLCDPIDGSPPGSRPWNSPGKNAGVGCHFLLQCMKVKSESEVAQSCLTFSDPMDCSPPGPSVHGVFQARVLEWGAIAFSTAQTMRSHLKLWLRHANALM